MEGPAEQSMQLYTVNPEGDAYTYRIMFVLMAAMIVLHIIAQLKINLAKQQPSIYVCM